VINNFRRGSVFKIDGRVSSCGSLFSHGTDGPSHDTEKEPWDGKGLNHIDFHDTHGSHDTLHTLWCRVREWTTRSRILIQSCQDEHYFPLNIFPSIRPVTLPAPRRYRRLTIALEPL